MTYCASASHLKDPSRVLTNGSVQILLRSFSGKKSGKFTDGATCSWNSPGSAFLTSPLVAALLGNHYKVLGKTHLCEFARLSCFCRSAKTIAFSRRAMGNGSSLSATLRAALLWGARLRSMLTVRAAHFRVFTARLLLDCCRAPTLMSTMRCAPPRVLRWLRVSTHTSISFHDNSRMWEALGGFQLDSYKFCGE